MMTVLIVEDDRQLRGDIAEILALEGFASLQADNGEVGLQLAHERLPDYILCDVLMPGLSGYDVYEKLQCRPSTASIPFIFLTGYSLVELSNHGIELGTNLYIQKPFTVKALLSILNNAQKYPERLHFLPN